MKEGVCSSRTLRPQHVRLFGLNCKCSRPVPAWSGGPCCPAASVASLREIGRERPGAFPR
jgi:hypothetical protein